MKTTWIVLLISCWFLSPRAGAGTLSGEALADLGRVECGNLIYAKSQTSVCFADKFLSHVDKETNIRVAKAFRPVKLETPSLFKYPFCVFSGEGDFTLNEAERANLRKYLTTGGFILSSPGCSNKEWDNALRREIKACFPDIAFERIPMSHAIFSVFYNVPKLSLKSGGTTLLEGLFVNGRLVMIYSQEGLNDAKNAKGCCCCGGNQINECELVNVNILTYALLY